MAVRVHHYRLLDRLASGSRGETFAATDERLGRTVALELINPSLVADPHERRRFVREMRAAAAITHPRLIAIYEVLDDDLRPVVVSEHVHGQSVQAATVKGPLDPRDVARFGRELAEALAAAHAHGFVHGGISATSAFITADGHLKLGDLGFAQALSPEQPPADLARVPGDLHSRTMMVGTPVYMAPELLSGGAPSVRSDLYAAGVLLYKMATGGLPFAERMTSESLMEMLTLAPVPPSLLVAGIPAALERAVMCLLEKAPDSRFPTAESLGATLAVAERERPRV